MEELAVNIVTIAKASYRGIVITIARQATVEELAVEYGHKC